MACPRKIRQLADEYNVVKTESVELGRFKIILDTIGKADLEYPYSFIDLKNSVAVLARCNDKFVFINQYRHTVKRRELEISGGAIDENESPEEAAIRELREETGYEVKSLTSLGKYYPTVGVSNEICHLFYADCEKRENQSLEPLERIEIVLLAKDGIENAIIDGTLKHGMALVAWLKYKVVEEHVDRNTRTKL